MKKIQTVSTTLLCAVAIGGLVAGCAKAAPPADAPVAQKSDVQTAPPAAATPRTAAVVAPSPARPGPDIPALHWQQRSDWTNVKTDVTPKAVGDGKTDDTAALQAALDGAKSGDTIYFPAGTYRITAMLLLGKTRLVGVNLIGAGRDTRLLWDGEDGGKMLEVDGGPQSQYRGLTLDGNGVAAMGFYGHNDKAFVTGVVFRDMAFKNFKTAGIFYAPQGKAAQGPQYDRYANAETTYENCLFEKCGSGLYSQAFNDYDHTFTGCEFRDCGLGIRFGHGNFYMRDCHFERSTKADIFTTRAEHGCSVRRVTSVDSKQFIDYHSGVSPISIQDCHVANWTDAAGAMNLITTNALLLDNSFSNATVDGPAVVGRPRSIRLLSGNSLGGKTSAMFGKSPAQVIEIPAAGAQSTPLAATQHFLNENVQVAQKIFDAKVDFKAVGDGKADDTQALQNTIDAARAYGKDALAYIPSGKYMLTKTLTVTGENYRVGGVGNGTQLFWKGAPDATIMKVVSPQNITLQDMGVGDPTTNRKGVNAFDIVQDGSKGATRATYRGIRVFGKYQNTPDKGIFLRNLGSDEVVLLDQFQGNIHCEDSAAATILAGTSYEGVISLSGKGQQRSGFLGFMTRLATGKPYALIVKNNQSGVFSDFYTEQGHDGLYLSGEAGDAPGRITIRFPKVQFDDKPPTGKVVTGENFAGQLFVLSSQFYTQPKAMIFDMQGTSKQDIYLAGNFFYNAQPKLLQNSPATVLHLLGNGGKTGVDNNLPPADYSLLNPALDDLRKLGAMDLKLNFPWIKTKS